MFRRNAILLAVVVVVLAATVACDSSDSGSGGNVATATVYTQDDLTGTWDLRGFGVGRATLKFDDQGRLLRLNTGGGRFSGFFGKITVAADGQLSGKVTYRWSPSRVEALVFSDMRFTADGEVKGTLVDYTYDPAVGKYDMQGYNVRMTRYDSYIAINLSRGGGAHLPPFFLPKTPRSGPRGRPSAASKKPDQLSRTVIPAAWPDNALKAQ